MPYALRKAPNRNLYWVVSTLTGKKHSINPIPEERAKKQIRLLRAIEHGFKPSRNYRSKRLSAGRKKSCVSCNRKRNYSY